MKKLKKITALALATILTGTAFSCGKDKNEDINDSQESSPQEEQQTEKTVIDIAYCTYTNPGLDDKIGNFSKNNEEYTINITYYWDEAWEQYGGEDNYDYEEKAIEALHMDMVSGKVPDIIFGQMDDMLPLLNTDYFTDLYPLMDAGTVPREDFLPNFLEGFERDGELPLFAYGITLYTAIVSSEYADKSLENWSVDEMKQVFDTLPEDIFKLEMMGTVSDLPNYVLRKLIYNCVDLENSTCDFHGVFTDALDYTKSINTTENDKVAYFPIMEGDTLIRTATINGINSMTTQEVYAPFKNSENITFVGYPSTDGCGAIVSDNQDIFGILENSDCKEGAWAFICELFAPGFQLNNTTYSMNGIPVIDSVIDTAMEYDEWTRYSINYPTSKTTEGEILTQIDEKTKQSITEYIRSVKIDPYFDWQIINIAEEEYMKAINGEITSEEAADLIENRLNIYLSENS